MNPIVAEADSSCDPHSIRAVVEACGCDEGEAVDLLARENYDAQKAIRRYNLRSKYRRRASPRPPTAVTPSTPKSEATDLASSANDDGDYITIESNPTAPEVQHPVELEAVTDSAIPRHSGDASISVPLPDHFVSQFGLQTDLLDLDDKNGDIDLVTEDSQGWDFILPVITHFKSSLEPDPTTDYETFDLREVVAWQQYGASLKVIQGYLDRFEEKEIREHINDEIEGFPAMFYVVETNKEDVLRLWHKHGGDISSIHEPSKAPLLAFAIMHGETIQSDTTLMTATLLSLGASPDVIPSAYYSPYLRDIPEAGPSVDSPMDLTDSQKSWCRNEIRGKLARTCSLSQRYYLERAAKTKKPSRRQQQVAKRMNAEPLLGIANFLIGQTAAAKALLDTLLAHITEPGKKPLVLAFAGPSGHGKTELARRLGHILSLNLEVVDCTIFNREMELFGPRHPYVGADKGTPLNNFLAENHEKRCIVFLDEFEKTSPDIHKTLLLPFENGEYQDRRNLDKVNCSKTIWILATNAHDAIIQDFSNVNSRALFSEEDEAESKRLLKQLSYKIREDFRSHHGAPITGRMSEFLPFLPFSTGEQAVIVHKALLELSRKVRQPVNLSAGDEEKLLGNIRLRIRCDASLCRSLAESEYHMDLGARSLIVAVEKIKRLLVEEYLKVDEEIVEKADITEFVIDVKGGEAFVSIVPRKLR